MENIKTLVAIELLFIVIFSSLIIIDSSDNLGIKSITGRAIAGVTQETILNDLKATFPKLEFLKDIPEASICLIVNVDSVTSYSYDVVKSGGTTTIETAGNRLCKGQNNEDFIVSYISYEKLKEHIDNPPSFVELKRTGDGTNFYLYPSKQILSGVKLANPDEFNEKYSLFANKYLTSEEKAQLTTSPEARQAFSFASYLFYAIIGMIVLLLIVSIVIFRFSRKPEIKETLELVAYIKAELSEGYQEDQIRQALMSSGWKEPDVDQAFQTVKSEVTMPPGFS